MTKYDFYHHNGILALLMSFGGLIVALLAFIDKRNKRK